MAPAAEEVNFSLKVMINKEKTKVLFAEGDSNFADVLLSFLTLPLGTLVRLLQKHYGDQAPVFGSLNTLYNGLANLDNVHFWTEAGKLMLLNPRSSFETECRKLKLNIDDTEPAKYFTCEDWNCSYDRHSSINMYYGTGFCYCGKIMNREIGVEEEQNVDDDNGVFTIKTVSYLISDDLRIVPNVARSFTQTLTNLGVTKTCGAEQRTVTIGFNEIMDLLKGSLLSNTPLTDLILHRRHTGTPAIKFEPVPLMHQIGKRGTYNSEEMILKVMVQKSTNRFLFAQAEDDFVDFLFSLLTIPLAGVEWLLSGNSSLMNIDNLYSSSAYLNKHLKSKGPKNSLFKPELAPMHLSKNLFFALSEERTPVLYYTQDEGTEYLSPHKIYITSKLADFVYGDPKFNGSYVRPQGMYMITDDLTVTPLCMSSSLSIINEMEIQLSDVKELEIHIGLEEGLNILKASLISNCALSSGLSSILVKQPKQEHLVFSFRGIAGTPGG